MLQIPFASLMARCVLVLFAACGAAAAQDLGTMDPKPLPPLEHPDDPKTPAKDLFGRKTAPASMAARSIC
jgi:penicillin-insensitive murein endopeptidase